MSKDFRGASGQEQSWKLNTVKSPTEWETGFAQIALCDEFVGTDPLDRARFAHNVLDFLAC